MRRNALILYWLLLLVPTLLIGGIAIALLRHEQERINRAAFTAIEDRARTVATTLDLAISETQRGLIQTLAGFSEADLPAALKAWRTTNPLVRNVFIWRPDGGLLYPDPRQPGTQEEGEFVRRYEGLFSGRVPWQLAAPESSSAQPVPARQRPSPRQELQVLTQQSSGTPQTSVNAPEPRGVWLPWFSENTLSFLGWVQPVPNGPRRGVEMETTALLSRLVPALPADPPPGMAFALLDGSGALVHQTGAVMVSANSAPLVRLPVGPSLPHWEVAVYADRGIAAGTGGQAFLVLSCLLAGSFVAAILAGGALLLREAHRSQRESQQKSTFVSNVSHELKTPLTSIRMYAELLGEDRVPEKGKRQRYLGIIISESQRLTRLINNVLDFSRVEQGRKKYHVEELDPAQTVAGVLDTQAARLAEAGLQVTRNFPAGPRRVLADRDALEQVLINLLDNAAKYAAEGKELTVEIAEDEHRLRIAIGDRGPGVPPAERERVFETFHRLDDSLTRRKPGVGLGLTISRRMMRDLGGDLVCEARDGGGANFVIVLPRGLTPTAKETPATETR